MSKPYIKNCCFFCTEREVNCKGCAIAKEGIEEITKKCQKHLEAGICTETFGGTVNKNLCFAPDDKDLEELEGKSTVALSVGSKEEKKPEKKVTEKVTKEDKTNKIVEALKESAKNGDIDINTLLSKLGYTKINAIAGQDRRGVK